jgi:hypothetical protein
LQAKYSCLHESDVGEDNQRTSKITKQFVEDSPEQFSSSKVEQSFSGRAGELSQEQQLNQQTCIFRNIVCRHEDFIRA